ncbi:MAG: hypothetical protein ABW321_13920 [Polyangiales bacterium]
MTDSKRAWWLAAALSACTGEVSSNPLVTSPAELQLTAAEVPLAAQGGFADQRGGGVFVDAQGRAVRLGIDGTRLSLQSHPSNREAPGRVQRIVPVGADCAWVLTDTGVYQASSGWLSELRFGLAITSDDVIAAAVSGDDQRYVALRQGLYQLDAAGLSALTASGKPLAGISALAIAPAPDGSRAVWFVQGSRLRYAKQLARARYEINDAELPESTLADGVVGLAGVSAAPGSLGELWVLTERALLSFTPQLGFRSFEPPAQARKLYSAGRFVWLETERALYRYAADEQRWRELTMAQTSPQLLAADASGTAWLSSAGESLALGELALPRVLGLFESGRVYSADVQLSARVLAADAPQAVAFNLDDGEHVVRELEHAREDAGSLQFSLGGYDASGREQSYSLAGLAAGLHTLTISALTEHGVTTRRLHFDMRAAEASALSWSSDVQPIYAARCAKCHDAGPGRALGTYQAWVDQSELIVRALVEARMPADGPLDPSQIQTIQRWAAGGAEP